MQYGYFDDNNREYVITRPDTPLPWINYLGCEDFFGIISNTAGGYCFYRDACLRRLTRYRYNNVPFDFGGRYIYIRDNDLKEFWSPSWMPTFTNLDKYECRHGLGYSIINSTYKNIEVSIKYFIPLSKNLEVWWLTIANNNNISKDISIFSFVEFCLWNAEDDASNYQRNFNTGEVEVENSTIYHKTEYRERRNHFAFFSCSEQLEGFDTQRDTFLGAYRSLEKPIVVEKGTSSNSITLGWSPIGSHHIKMILNPCETRTVIFLLGYFENPEDQKFDPLTSQKINKKYVKNIIEENLVLKNVEESFSKLRAYWDNILSIFHVETPDIHTNRMVNIWNVYNNMVTFNISRSASFFESGTSRGYGFRDSNQDILGFVHMIPKKARERILDLAATQLFDGGVFHQYQPLTKTGNNRIGGNFNDDPIWLVISTIAYIRETGDLEILNEEVIFENTPGTEQPLIEHLYLCFKYIIERLGPHKLPLIGRADWNDCLNLNAFSKDPDQLFQTVENINGKTAESVFLAGLFIFAARDFSELLNYLGKENKANYYNKLANEMEEVVITHGWDGKWFIRAYDNFGNKVGSNSCKEGRIFIEPQGICIMAKIGLKNGFAKSALQSVKEHLATQHGIILLQPAYSRYHLNLGEISSYPPGLKENGSIFCHSNPWIMIAECLVGNGDRAFEYYKKINPSTREEMSDIHRTEPYVYSQMIAGKDHPKFGEAKNSWLTGTSSWNYVAITQWILGIKPTLNGLRISPVIPKNWSGFKATRVYRGTKYKISVIREGDGNEPTLEVDGYKIVGNLIPIFPSSSEVNIIVYLK